MGPRRASRHRSSPCFPKPRSSTAWTETPAHQSRQTGSGRRHSLHPGPHLKSQVCEEKALPVWERLQMESSWPFVPRSCAPISTSLNHTGRGQCHPSSHLGMGPLQWLPQLNGRPWPHMLPRENLKVPAQSAECSQWGYAAWTVLKCHPDELQLLHLEQANGESPGHSSGTRQRSGYSQPCPRQHRGAMHGQRDHHRTAPYSCPWSASWKSPRRDTQQTCRLDPPLCSSSENHVLSPSLAEVHPQRLLSSLQCIDHCQESVSSNYCQRTSTEQSFHARPCHQSNTQPGLTQVLCSTKTPFPRRLGDGLPEGPDGRLRKNRPKQKLPTLTNARMKADSPKSWFPVMQ